MLLPLHKIFVRRREAIPPFRWRSAYEEGTRSMQIKAWPVRSIPDVLMHLAVAKRRRITVNTKKKQPSSRYLAQICMRTALGFMVALPVLPAGIAFAQESTGTVVGNVSDVTGASIVGARVTATNTATNTSRNTLSDASGQYSLPSLPVGQYVVSVAMTGFGSKSQSGLTLDASQTARVDFQITAGGVDQTVTVNAAANEAALQTENAAVGEVIGGKKIVDLPLNGRNFVQLAQLIPGVSPGASGSITVRRARGSVGSTDASFGSTAIQVNGQRDTQNRYLIDGIEAMDYDAFTYAFSPSIDAVSEFRVDTSTSGPDVGAAAGANVNLLIKSGTNQLHGTLWEFNRNNAFTQTYDALAHLDAVSARLNRNQFGANVGGPVAIPHLYNGRDKTFFFFNWESGRALNGANVQTGNVPTAAVRTGDVSQLKGVVDPLTGSPFPNNQIPMGRISPAATVLLSYTPEPNVTGGTLNFATTPVKTLSYQNEYLGRLDHTIGQHDTINGHYIFDETYTNGGAFFGNDESNNHAVAHHLEITETHVFSPSLVNEFRYGRLLFQEYGTVGTTGNPNFDVANKMGIPLASSDPRFFGPPTVTISGPDGVFRPFGLINIVGPRNRANGINQFVDQASFQKGKHFLRGAVDIGYRTDYFSQARDPRGTFLFDGRYSGSAQVDFLLGYIGTDSINPTVTTTHISSLVQGYSIGDDWRITPNLTLNLGFRYDHFAPWVQADDRYADIFIAANGINAGAVMTPATSPYGRGLIHSPKLDLAPRVGFAWQPYGPNQVVVRGGFGLYYTPELPNAYFTMAEGDQAQSGAQLTGNLHPVKTTPVVPTLTFANPFPGVTPGGPLTYPFDTAIDQNLQDQRTAQYNLTVQTELPGKLSGQIAYVGATGRHNFVYYNDINLPTPTNPATPGLAPIAARRPNQTLDRAVQGDFSRGTSEYNALQAKLERRMNYGLTTLFAYTWSKSISGPADVGGIVGGGFYGAQALNPYNFRSDRSLSVFDLPQRFVGTVLYDVPFFRNTRGLTKAALDGFQVSTIVTAQSGIAAGVTNSLDTTATGLISRPDMVPGQSSRLASGARSYSHFFNTAAFRTAAPGEFGTSPRSGAVRLPGYVNDDFSATKGIKFGESRNLQLRADFFNLLKHYNPDPSTVGLAYNGTNFGVVAGGTKNGFATRVIQLAAKLYF